MRVLLYYGMFYWSFSVGCSVSALLSSPIWWTASYSGSSPLPVWQATIGIALRIMEGYMPPPLKGHANPRKQLQRR